MKSEDDLDPTVTAPPPLKQIDLDAYKHVCSFLHRNDKKNLRATSRTNRNNVDAYDVDHCKQQIAKYQNGPKEAFFGKGMTFLVLGTGVFLFTNIDGKAVAQKLDFFDDKKVTNIAFTRYLIYFFTDVGVYEFDGVLNPWVLSGPIANYGGWFSSKLERQEFFDDKEIALDSNGRAIADGNNSACWVATDRGVFTLVPDSVEMYKPERIRLFDGVEIKGISSGLGHQLVRLSNNSIHASGANSLGQCGLGHISINASGQINDFVSHEIKQVVSGEYHNFVLTNKGLYSFGDNFSGQLGAGRNRDFQPRPTAMQFFKNKHVKKIVAGKHHSMAWCDDGVYAWGNESQSQTGVDGFHYANKVYRPVKLEFFDDKNIENIASGQNSSIVFTDKDVYVFGDNSKNQLGIHQWDYVIHPQRLPLASFIENTASTEVMRDYQAERAIEGQKTAEASARARA